MLLLSFVMFFGSALGVAINPWFWERPMGSSFHTAWVVGLSALTVFAALGGWAVFCSLREDLEHARRVGGHR